MSIPRVKQKVAMFRLLLASIIAATALTACDVKKVRAPTPTPTSPGGSDRARWGMSASEIQAAYPAATPQKRETYGFGEPNYYCELTLTPTPLQDTISPFIS